jgi:DNA polymerase-3 subunit alpha
VPDEPEIPGGIKDTFEASRELQEDAYYSTAVEPAALNIANALQPADDWSADREAILQDDLPPPPDLFPSEWELANAVVAAVADPAGAREAASAPADVEAKPSTPGSPGIEQAASPPAKTASVPPALLDEGLASEASGALTGYIVSPIPPADGEPIHMITIVLRPSEDKIRDNLRIRQIYGTLITYPGKDRFAFHVFERGRGYLIEFPNFTTGFCPELLNRLKAFIPAEQLRVEPITFL